MRVFLTGATGFIGSAVVKELINAGHEVIGLARSDAAVKSLEVAGASAHRGSLEDVDSLQKAAVAADAVIHLGFIHDFSKFKECCEHDRKVIAALGQALLGTNKKLIVTSGLGVLRSGEIATEASTPVSGPSAHPRAATEEAANAIAAQGVNVSIVRLPPSVHGEGDHGFVPILINLARQQGKSVYTNTGDNLWPAVHKYDAAVLYRLVLEKGRAGSVYHGAAEEGIPFRKIAEVIGNGLGLPTTSKTTEDAAKHFTWFAHFAAMNIPTSSQKTRQELDWQPSQPGLIADIQQSNYFVDPQN